ncbi:MAG: PHB depolymerase family esterase [Ramlibacter sp.]|nr:PHB depolymerase family esterase [Ramlibacter sp.]
MQAATRLTASRDLAGATAVIQAALQSAGLSAGSHTPAPKDTDVIDVPAHEVHEATGESPVAPSGEPEAFIAGNAHGRDYKLYIPSHSGAKKLPLIVMLHGCTQNPDDFAAGTRMNDAARVQGCFVLYPAQSSRANPQRCWNWFKHSHQVRGRGEPAILAAMTSDIALHYPIDPARVYVAGLSAGGAMAAILVDTYPEIYAAAGIHSGLAAGAAKDLPSALSAMKSGGSPVAHNPDARPTIVFHGDADTTVHPSNAGHVIHAATTATSRAELKRDRSAGGRDYTRSVHRSADGRVIAEHWVVHGSGHAWAGGSPAGSYTDANGPDATAQMLRFFLEHPRLT